MKERVLALAAFWILRLLGFTMRKRVRIDAAFLNYPPDRPMIHVFWHNRIIAAPLCYAHFSRRWKRTVVLTSASRDGALLSAFVRRYGVTAVRGSSSRRGAEALRELTSQLAAGTDVIVTPDGPRGPRYQLGAGVVFLAQKTGAPIVSFQVEYSRCLRLKSWDQFMIPLPFSRVEVTVGAMLFAATTHSDAEFEAERARIEQALQPITQ